jgi:hypothetical protein
VIASPRRATKLARKLQEPCAFELGVAVEGVLSKGRPPGPTPSTLRRVTALARALPIPVKLLKARRPRRIINVMGKMATSE